MWVSVQYFLESITRHRRFCPQLRMAAPVSGSTRLAGGPCVGIQASVSLVDTPACPRRNLTGVSPGLFHTFSAATTTNRMPAGRPCAERSRSAVATSRLGHRPGPPSDPLRDHTQPGLAILRLLDPDRSARTGPLRTGRRRRPPQYPLGISRNCRQNLNPREIHPGPP